MIEVHQKLRFGSKAPHSSLPSDLPERIKLCALLAFMPGSASMCEISVLRQGFAAPHSATANLPLMLAGRRYTAAGMAANSGSRAAANEIMMNELSCGTPGVAGMRRRPAAAVGACCCRRRRSADVHVGKAIEAPDGGGALH